MRIVLCTAWLGPADTLSPLPASCDVAALCMTDRPAAPRGWIRCPPEHTAAPRRMARWAKTHTSWLPAHDVSIWMDASFALLTDPSSIVRLAAKALSPVMAFVHPDRTRISEEAAAIIRCGQADPDATRRQIATYQAAGFDRDDQPQTVLSSTGFMVRWASSETNAFLAAWWQELERHTLRDQLSIDYCAWRQGLTLGYLPGHYRSNTFVKYDHRAHRRGRIDP